MGFLLTLPVRLLLALVQRLPIRGAVRLGRGFGAVAWWIAQRHRRIALENLTAVFGSTMTREEIKQLAREHFRRLGENYAGAIRTAVMSADELQQVVEFSGLENLPVVSEPVPNLVFAGGHFGNFELCGRVKPCLPHWQTASTYRAIHPPALDRMLQELRARYDMRFFERTREARALRQFLAQGGVALGLLADQHAGARGLWIPFFGCPCSTSAAPVILAQRYYSAIRTCLCFRVALGRWRVEFGPPIPTRHADGSPREPAVVMGEVNAGYEAAILRDPANWFWVHRRWKPPTAQQLAQASTGAPSANLLSED